MWIKGLTLCLPAANYVIANSLHLNSADDKEACKITKHAKSKYEFVFSDWNSALMIVINGEADDHLEMLQGGVMRQLLDDKWKTYARVNFFKHI